MREIKFRAWDKDRSRYIGSSYPNNWNGRKDEWYDDVDKMDIEGIENISSNDMFVVEQFTGLRDKNGKEIYEGDIVSVTDVYGKKHNSIVAFNDGCFDVEGNSEPFHVRDYLKCSVVNHACVVIGNIHENPELLK